MDMQIDNMSPYNLWDTRSLFEKDQHLKIDMVENNDSYSVTAHTPGVKKDDIKIVFDNDVLYITVTRKEEKTHDVHYHIKECFNSSIMRSVRFHHGKIDNKDITATYVDGELVVTLPFLKNIVEKTSQIITIN